MSPVGRNSHPWTGAAKGTHHLPAGLPLPSKWACFYPSFLIGINPGPLIPNAPSANGYFSSLPQLFQEQGKTKLYFPFKVKWELNDRSHKIRAKALEMIKLEGQWCMFPLLTRLTLWVWKLFIAVSVCTHQEGRWFQNPVENSAIRGVPHLPSLHTV